MAVLRHVGRPGMSKCHIDLALQIFDPSEYVTQALLDAPVYLTPSGCCALHDMIKLSTMRKVHWCKHKV